MADKATVHIGENSPEEVAYKLFSHIVSVENKDLYNSGKANSADRAYILKAYYECRRVVVGGVNPDNR
jgi:hypothetical protein